jgi:hypothetical protein
MPLVPQVDGCEEHSPSSHASSRICDDTRSMYYLTQKRAHKAALRAAQTA